MDWSKKPLRVLIVDSREDDCAALKMMMRKIRDVASVVSVGTFKEAQAILGEDNGRCCFDVALVNLNPPDKSEAAVLRLLSEICPELAVVVIIGAYDDGFEMNAAVYGAQDYFVKGKDDEIILCKSINYAIERKKMENEMNRINRELEIRNWGLAKTNEAIKILYKELEKKNAELREIDTLKSDFVSVVSHELRTPLTAIKEGISLVLEGLAGEINDEQTEYLDIAKRNVDRLHRLINNVLDYERLESARVKLSLDDNDINEAVKEVVATQIIVAQEKTLYISTALQEGLPKIRFDYDRIEQVLANLVDNAIKYTSQGGITIKTLMDKECKNIMVIVKDTGEGIAQEDIPKLFLKFQQLKSENRRRTGTGLGLAICRGIIEKHGGKIWVTSQYGEGTEFMFTLPMQQES